MIKEKNLIRKSELLIKNRELIRKFKISLFNISMSVKDFCESTGLHYSTFSQAINGWRKINSFQEEKMEEFIDMYYNMQLK